MNKMKYIFLGMLVSSVCYSVAHAGTPLFEEAASITKGFTMDASAADRSAYLEKIKALSSDDFQKLCDELISYQATINDAKIKQKIDEILDRWKHTRS